MRGLFTPRIRLKRHLSAADHFDRRTAKFYDNFTFDKIKTGTSQGELSKRLREVEHPHKSTIKQAFNGYEKCIEIAMYYTPLHD